MNSNSEQAPVIRIGRITAALLLVVIGILLLADQFLHTNMMLLLLTWWPLILICWGLEAIWFRIIRSERKWRVDFLGMFTALFITAIIFTASQPNMFRDWLRDIQFDFSMMKQMSQLKGDVFEKPPLVVDMTEEPSQMDISHSTGDIYIKTGKVEQLEINSLVTVYNADKDKVRGVADQIQVKVSRDTKSKRWTIKAEGLEQLLRLGMHVSVDIEVAIPEDTLFPITVNVQDGDVFARRLNGGIHATSKSGDLWAEAVTGDVVMETNNGDVDVRAVTGKASLQTKNGDISVADVAGEARLVSKSGDLSINEVHNQVYAETLNGDISLESSVMGNDWQLQALAGDIDIRLPISADARIHVRQSFGDVESDYPLHAIDGGLETLVGNGSYQLTVEVNGDLTLK